MTSTTLLDQLCINTLRTISIDAVQQAQSGHPGTDGRCTARLLFVAALFALRSGEPYLDKSGSFCIIVRACLNVVVQLAFFVRR